VWHPLLSRPCACVLVQLLFAVSVLDWGCYLGLFSSVFPWKTWEYSQTNWERANVQFVCLFPSTSARSQFVWLFSGLQAHSWNLQLVSRSFSSLQGSPACYWANQERFSFPGTNWRNWKPVNEFGSYEPKSSWVCLQTWQRLSSL
jgi:hypothetical protein